MEIIYNNHPMVIICYSQIILIICNNKIMSDAHFEEENVYYLLPKVPYIQWSKEINVLSIII